MESQITIYIYKEKSLVPFNEDSQRPFLMTDLAKEMAKKNLEIFKSSGGLRVIDYFENSFVFVRMSFWSEETQYAQWEQKPEIQVYLQRRNQYHNQKNITVELSGPLAGVHYG